ncbi:hypothetical protein K488DRAFT_88911 [Vararia minispora EC-137]|uniref:Uncharacterized protein n=1 Tax=Vararia minispora EC-137 TaxID=1314806 RepID=A0ACB8QCF9_9AGAM|nr:hypothetical protein K488DRAFT_88911 [Vararia minispora EC-137]
MSYLTPERAIVSAQLWKVTSAVGAGLCFAVLATAVVLYTRRASRVHLDRVSFRIVLYALVANMIFGISSAVGGSLTGPSTSCGLSVFLLLLTLQVSSFLLFCIALNLELVVVHGVNSQKVEPYYIAGSIALALALTIPPYAAGQYGWDSLEQECWYTNEIHHQRVAWQVGTQLVWTGLASIGEVVAASIVTCHMLRIHARIFNATRAHTHTHSSTSSSSLRRRLASDSSASRATVPSAIHANAYKTVIARIALYPMASCIVNLTSIATVIHTTITNGVHSRADYNILLLSDFLYGGRAIVYAVLAATDPALLRAARAFITDVFGWRWAADNTTTASLTTTYRKNTLRVRVELNTIRSIDFGGAGTEPAAKTPVEDAAERGKLRVPVDDAASLADGDAPRTPVSGDKLKMPTSSASDYVDDASEPEPSVFRTELNERRGAAIRDRDARRESAMEAFARRI